MSHVLRIDIDRPVSQPSGLWSLVARRVVGSLDAGGTERRCRSTSAKGRKGVFGKLGCRDGEILQLEKPFLDYCVLVYFQLAAGSTTAGCPGLPGGEICKRLCQCAGTSFARQDRAAAAGAGKSFSRRSAPRRGYYGARAVPAALWIQPQVLTAPWTSPPIPHFGQLLHLV